MDVCNAKRDGKCLRYRPHWKERDFGRQHFLQAYEMRLQNVKDDLAESQLDSGNAVILRGDCRKSIATFRRKFRVCITSPPYLNSFDYTDIYRPELFLGRFVSDNEGLRKLRVSCIRSHLQAKWDTPEGNGFGTIYSDCIDRINGGPDRLWDSRIPLMIQAYFEDMQTVLAALFKRTHAKGILWMVVSTSAYAGVKIPVDLIISEMAERIGWNLRGIDVLRDLRSAGQHIQKASDENTGLLPLRESLVKLERRPAARS
jgi:hypothetical protein